MKTSRMMVVLSAYLFVTIGIVGAGRAAELSGTVTFKGVSIVEKVAVTMDKSTCGETIQKVRLGIGSDGGVQDAVVWLEGAGLDAAPKKSGKAAVLDQEHCMFKPFISIVPVGSKLVVANSDSVLHNAHGFWMADKSSAFNVAVPMPGLNVDVPIKKAGFIKVRCDAGHTWMEAYVADVRSHYFARTDDAGHFMIHDVPAGNYTLHAWHPLAGEREVSVKVPSGKPVEAILPGRDVK